MSELKEVTIQDIIAKKKENSRRVDTKFIIKAYNYALEKHGDQKRISGEPYIIHPMEVVKILIGLRADKHTLMAGFLHDILDAFSGI